MAGAGVIFVGSAAGSGGDWEDVPSVWIRRPRLPFGAISLRINNNRLINALIRLNLTLTN
jgi:hypothetical protein